MEERGEAEGLLGLRLVVVRHGVLGEEHREHVPGGLQPVRHALLGERGGDQAGDLGGDPVDGRVDLVGAAPQLGQAGRGGDRVPGERAGLVDRAGRGEVGHHVGAAAEGRRREAAAHDLAEGQQVGRPALVRGLQAVPARLRHAEAGHHLVGDEQRAVLPAEPGQAAVEAGQRRDDAHVAGRGLGDHAGDLAGVGPEGRLDGGEVVVRQHDGVAGLGAGDARGVRQAEGGEAGTGGGQQRVHVAVVAAGELHDLGPAGEAPGQPDRRHGGLGAGGDQADLLDRGDPGDDLLGQLDLALPGRAEGGAAGDRFPYRVQDGGVRVAEDHRTPRADQVDVLAAVGVGQVGAGSGHHEARRTADGAEGAHRGVHAAGRDDRGTIEERLGLGCFVGVAHGRHGLKSCPSPLHVGPHHLER